jgi:hypothetical protein
MASTFSHLWLWQLGKETHTWMGLPPMHDAPYVAFYEEAEILAGLRTGQKEMREALPESCALLIAEYQKHLLARGRFYFPAELPEDLVVQEPREAVLKPKLYIPLEGLGAPGGTGRKRKLGGLRSPGPLHSGCAVLAPSGRRAFVLFCTYPIFDMEHSGDRRSGAMAFKTGGTSQLSCHLSLVREGYGA